MSNGEPHALTVDEHLDGTGATLVDGSEGLAQTHFGITDRDLIDLCGVPRGASVQVELVPDWTNRLEDESELVPPGLHVMVRADVLAPDSQNEFVLYREADGENRLYFKLIDFRVGLPYLRGVGAALVRRIAHVARNMGFHSLRMLAAGGRVSVPRAGGTRWGGYYVWPMAGFEMALADTPEKAKVWNELVGHFRYMPKNLSDCKTVQELLDREMGADYWKVCGEGHYMEFQLH